MAANHNYGRQLPFGTKSLLVIYVAFYSIYHVALLDQKVDVLLVTTLFFALGLLPYLYFGSLNNRITFPKNTNFHNASLLASFSFILFAIYISFSDILFALAGSHSELHVAGGGVSTTAIMLINTATILLSRSLRVVNSEPNNGRFIIIGSLLILLIAIPFSRNPVLPAIFTLLIILRPLSFSRPISISNVWLGILIVTLLVLFDLRRAFGTGAFFSGEALLDINIFRYITESAELQVVNRVHDALLYTHYSSIDSFIDALLISPFLNLFSLVNYDDLPSASLSNLYDTTGGFSMLMMAYLVSPFLVSFVSFITFGIGLIALTFLNRLFPAYSVYSLAIVCSYLVNSFRIDFAISIKMLAGYVVPLLLLRFVFALSDIVARVIKNVSKQGNAYSSHNR